MDPSIAVVRRQGNKATESTTDDGEERFRLWAQRRRNLEEAHIVGPGKLGRGKLRPYKRIGNCETHPRGWGAHLYCIGDGTLIGHEDGESGLAIVRMRRFGVLQT